jgi:VanZ family protein
VQYKQKRVWIILILSLILMAVIGFLLQTSQDVRWGGGFWETWLKAHWRLTPVMAHQLVFLARKMIHFMAYGSLALLFWWYFYLWGLRRAAAGVGLTATALVAAFDEYNQALSNFRTGKLTDVLLDCCGGLVFILAAYGVSLRRSRKQRVTEME